MLCSAGRLARQQVRAAPDLILLPGEGIGVRVARPDAQELVRESSHRERGLVPDHAVGAGDAFDDGDAFVRGVVEEPVIAAAYHRPCQYSGRVVAERAK